MKLLVIAIATLVLLAPALAGAQGTTPQTSPAPSAPATPPPAPGSPSTPGTDPASPRSQVPATPDTAPPAPGAPTAPGDRGQGDGRILGLSPLVAVIFGLIILGVIIALMAGRRRDRDVAVDTRIDTPLPPERPLGTTESDLERERRRRAS
jgi:hypothetical protein